MNYRTATRQQLLAERARLTNAYRKAEQRFGASARNNVAGGSPLGRNQRATRVPKQEIDQLADQLAQVEAELKRRDEQAAQPAETAGEEAPPAADPAL